ncbi:MAG: DUF4395 family protein [Anaerolineales bacterium]|nr:DUF4395 family protein [Anaerolineales bacterium]
MSTVLSAVDYAALRTNQAAIVTLLVVVFDVWWWAAMVMLVMAFGAPRRQPGFRFIYAGWLRPRSWVKPEPLRDNAEPRLFAQSFGAVMLLAAMIALLAGAPVLGRALVWLVVALAALNLLAGCCPGGAMQPWLNRLRLPGFVKAPPPGTSPGMRPSSRPLPTVGVSYRCRPRSSLIGTDGLSPLPTAWPARPNWNNN